ncbi:MAG: hypothetical protein QGF49_07555, partial [Candidatus Marinimicrobia bacterium]|nr:hypothetical protein [Candidatus Neomarinimicrobiota bacterium]
SLPTIDDDLVLSYDYFDLEGDVESGTVITWFKADSLGLPFEEQSQFSGQLTIPASATACDEVWYVAVTPSDGESFGGSIQSNSVTICGENTLPEWLSIPDQHINEDSGENTIDISGFITDNEQAPSQMTFQVIDNSDPDHLGTAFDGYNLLLTPLVLNYYTIEPIILTLEADDGNGGVVTQMVNIFIDPANDFPEITGQDELFTPEETPLTITLGDLSVEDADNTYPDDFTLTVLEGDNYTIEGGPGSGPAYPDDFSFTTTPSSGAFLGQVTIDGVSA